MSGQPPSGQEPGPKNKGLTPVQIGGCVGAVATLLSLLVVRDLSRPVAPHGQPGSEGISPFVGGLLSGLGALAGMSLVALVGLARRRNREGQIPGRPAPAGAEAGGTAEPAPAHETQAGDNGRPAFRVAAGVAALLFGGTAVLVAVQGKGAFSDLLLVVVLASLFGWYAVRGRKGLPRFLSR
jgi:hypothetical protein